MSIISKKINARITTIKNEFLINKDVEHKGIKGGLNESEVSSLIKEVISQRYRVARGIIENATGAQSKETDIFVYDDEILPPYIKKDVTFIPVEAVKYVFEVKSVLNSTELKTTISKFENFKSIGGRSPTVLFAYSSDIDGSELSRYKRNDPFFLTNPAITVLCISGKSYYFKDTSEHLLKDKLSVEEFLKLTNKAGKFDIEPALNAFSDILSNDDLLSSMSRSQFALLIKASMQSASLNITNNDRKLVINGLEYEKIKFKIHKWMGIESDGNDIELSLLSGISNTLSKGNFGNYLLHGKDLDMKIFSICYEDMWGNLSCQDFNERGITYNPLTVSFSFQTSSESNKIEFKIKEQAGTIRTIA
ncbi:MAG: hypothetical protein EOO15_06360 [Chitinophagaceae bacterium]|nr:MAG: hypothetical protein EOO15_06360 [Chitinophagaceae bacterium]